MMEAFRFGRSGDGGRKVLLKDGRLLLEENVANNSSIDQQGKWPGRAITDKKPRSWGKGDSVIALELELAMNLDIRAGYNRHHD